MKSLEDAPFVDLLSPEYASDPAKVIAPVAAQSWLARTAIGGLVVRREQAHRLLTDRRLRASMLPFLLQQGITGGAVWERMSQSLLALDGTDHDRLRRLLSSTFSPRAVNARRPAIQQAFASLLEPVLAVTRTEFMAEVADQYPMYVICELLGIPQQDRETFAGWNRACAWVVNFDLAHHREEAEWGVTHMVEYLVGIIADRRFHPQDDLITALIQTEDAGDRLTDAELVSTIGDLLLAGGETTTNQLGIAMWLFCQHPGQWELLRGRPELVPQAVEEVMRYAGVVRVVPRLIPEDIEFDDYLLPAGSLLLVSTMAANHDPAVYAEGGFDVTVRREPQMTFGAGAHFCLGASLARAELQEALLAMTRSIARIVLDGDPTWQPALGTYGPRSLPLRLKVDASASGGVI